MPDNETPQLSKAEKKEKIRAKYRGLCADGIEFIPARVQRNIFEDDTHKRVGIYARVSTVTDTFLQHGNSDYSL